MDERDQISRLLFAAALIAISFAARASEPPPHQPPAEDQFYRIETVAVPANVVLEVGGMGLMPGGGMMIGTRRGELWSFHKNQWKRFASGLDEVMGVCPTASNQVVISQRPELTRVTDTDGDGEADLFETLADQWNYSGQIYEWTFGPVRDRDGNFFGTLACWFFPSMKFEPTPYSGWEIPPLAGYVPSDRTAWRGWSFKVTPGGEFIPWSVGLRSPNGLAFSPSGDLFVSDNQGEYLGSCFLHHITEHAFHGHPNGLLWDSSAAATNPFSIPLDELEARRKPPAIVFPYGVMGQSASQPLWDETRGKFGPFAGQMFIGDQTKSTLMRVVLEKVGGEFQGACLPFRAGFQCGNNRLLFDRDGSLLVGQTDRGWGALGGKPHGLQRVVWTGETPMEIHSMKLTPTGFDVTFTKRLDAGSAKVISAYSLQSFHYLYHRKYGSPQVDEKTVAVSAVHLSSDGKTVSLMVPELAGKKIYALHLTGVKADDGSEVVHPVAYYTLNKLCEPASAARVAR